MKYVLLLLSMLFQTINSLSQDFEKQKIDFLAIQKWRSIGNSALSCNGKYVFYTINNQPTGSNTLGIQSTSFNWKREFVGVSSAFFIDEDKKIVFKNGDSLILLELGTNNLRKYINVSSFSIPKNNKRGWLAYQFKNPNNELVLQNVATGEEQVFTSVADYLFNDDGSILLLKSNKKDGDTISNALQLVNLENGKSITIWSSKGLSDSVSTVSSFIFDAEGKQVAFIVKERSQEQYANVIWYYNVAKSKAIVKLTNPCIEADLLIDDSNLQFSNNGQWVYINLKESIAPSLLNDNAVKVDIWSYSDKKLQSVQLQHQAPRVFLSAISTTDNSVVRLEREDEGIQIRSKLGNHVIIINNSTVSDPFWDSKYQRSCYLFSIGDKSKKFIEKQNNVLGSFSFSPQEKYLVYYNKDKKNYFSYNIKTGVKRNITQSIHVRLYNEYVYGDPYPVGIAGWLESDTALLIYDEYDIWEVDPAGRRPSINITNGFGRLNKIKLALINEAELENKALIKSEIQILTGFNVYNKNNSLYLKSLLKKANPDLLTEGPFIIYINKLLQTPNITNIGLTMKPKKARDTDLWIVQRMTASSAPNLFITKDFKVFKEITDLQPQKEYNWLSTELITWKQLDGTQSQGILYKPENFDPQKKYPVIFNYYEQRSFDLNAFPEPGLSRNEINVPWFVSRGYLVFKPDFHFSVARLTNRTNGENAYNAVVSAVQYLSKIPWVDVTRIGLNGHSFGGGVTNYLVTHTSHLFAAAVEGAGPSDAISSNLSLGGPLGKPDYNRLSGTQIDQGRMGATIWQRPDLYIRNSSIFKLNKVTTPLLIMHNMGDPAVPWAQGVELFLGLRYFGKKVWMLQYDNGAHSVYGKDAIDYTIRITQFFDHYLKGLPAPEWMTKGVCATKKGIETGYELTPFNNCGVDCKVCMKINANACKGVLNLFNAEFGVPESIQKQNQLLKSTKTSE